MTKKVALEHFRFYKRYVAVGLAASIILFMSFVAWTESLQPTKLIGPNGDRPVLSTIPPFVDGDWIKIPFDRERSAECLTQSTFSLQRMHHYGPPLNDRADDVAIGLRNNPLSGKGKASKLLWFPRPPVPAGDWQVVVDAGHDCGSWIDPGKVESGPVALGIIALPPPTPEPATTP